MEAFVTRHQAHTHGVLSCFDRMLFRGYLPITSGWSMAQFLNGLNLAPCALKPFFLDSAQRVKQHAEQVAKRQGRPFEFLRTRIRMEALQLVRKEEHSELWGALQNNLGAALISCPSRRPARSASCAPRRHASQRVSQS